MLRIPLPYEKSPVSDDSWNRWFGPLPGDETEEEKLANTFHIFSLDQRSVFTTATVIDAINLFNEKKIATQEPATKNLYAGYYVSSQQIEHFHDQGFVLLKDVFRKNEIERIEPHISNAVYELDKAEDKSDKSKADRNSFLRAAGLWEHDVVSKDFIFDERFASIARALLKTDRVRLYHDQAFFKEQEQGITPWHQDRYYWPIETNSILTLWVPLVEVSPEMGPLKFINGSHKLGALGNIDDLSRSNENLRRFLEDKHLSVTELKSVSMGDVTAHWGWTIHGAGPNNSTSTRKALTIIYYADGATLKYRNPQQEQTVFDRQAAYIRQLDMERWFNGLGEGDIAASRLTPIQTTKQIISWQQ